MTPERADGGAHAAGDRLREFIDEMVSEASERQGQADVYRLMREWSHEEASEAEARALTKWAKKLTKAVRELVPVPPQLHAAAITVKTTQSSAGAVPPAPSGAPQSAINNLQAAPAPSAPKPKMEFFCSGCGQVVTECGWNSGVSDQFGDTMYHQRKVGQDVGSCGPVRMRQPAASGLSPSAPPPETPT